MSSQSKNSHVESIRDLLGGIEETAAILRCCIDRERGRTKKSDLYNGKIQGLLASQLAACHLIEQLLDQLTDADLILYDHKSK